MWSNGGEGKKKKKDPTRTKTLEFVFNHLTFERTYRRDTLKTRNNFKLKTSHSGTTKVSL